MFVYHYHAIYQRNKAATAHLDGIIVIDKKLTTYEQYTKMKECISSEYCKELTICSLTLLDGE